MISCSAEWKSWLDSNDYTLKITLNNTDENFKNLDIPFSDVVQNSLQVNRFSATSSTIEIGSATAAEVQVTLDNSVAKARGYLTKKPSTEEVQMDGYDYDDVAFEGARVTFAFKHSDSTLPFLIATVDEVTRQGDYIHLVLLDDMVKLDKPVSGTIPTSVSGLLSAICTASQSFEFANNESNLVNSSVTLAAPTSTEVTYRQLLQWVCQITGTCAYIGVVNGSAKLILDWYHKTYLAVPSNAEFDETETYYTKSGSVYNEASISSFASGTTYYRVARLSPSNRFSSTIDQQPIEITGVSVKVGETNYEAKYSSAYLLQIENNELIDDNNAEDIAIGLEGRLEDTIYTPFTAETNGLAYLQPLDMVVFTDKDGNDHDVIITDWTFSPYLNVKLEGKGESQTRRGYATNAPFTAAQTKIIEEIRRNQPEVNVDSRLIATLSLNEAINNGAMLNNTTYDSKTYYHDGSTLADSTYIVTATTNGIAWTTQGWNNGDPTWEYGITGNGNTILNQLQAYSVNADLITAGAIDASNVSITNLNASNITSGAFEVKDGNTTIHKLGTDKSAILGGANGITYDVSSGKIILGSNVVVNGSLSISQSIQDAISGEVDDQLDTRNIRGIDHQTVDYQSGTSPTTAPTGTWVSTPPTVAIGDYLWVRTQTYYSDDPTNVAVTSYSVVKQSGIESAGSNYYAIGTSPTSYNSNDLVPLNSQGNKWVGSVPNMTNYRNQTTQYYLWTRKSFVYSKVDGSSDTSTTYMYTVTAINSDGDDGNGITNTTIRYGIGTSGTDSRTVSSWDSTIPSLSPGDYLWTRTTLTYSDGTTSNSYSVAYCSADGRAGTNGADGTSSYIYVRYSAYEEGVDENQQISYSAVPDENTAYIGVYVSASSTAPPSSENPYTWSRYRGADGDEGQPGQNGIDGTSEYIHFAYSSGADGTGTFNTSPFAGAQYLGVRHDDTETDSQTPSDYQWSLIQGAGVATIEYVQTSSGTSVPGSSAGWNTTMPATNQGKWLWTRITYTDGSTAYSKTYQGKDGSDGATITSKVVEYAISSDGSNPPPSNQQGVGQLTYTTETWYCAAGSTYSTTSAIRTALQSNWDASGINKSAKACALTVASNKQYVFSLTRTDYSDGTYEIDNVTLLGTYGTSGSQYSITETFYVIAASSSLANNKISNRTQFLSNYNNGAGTEVNDRISALQWTSSNQYLYSFDVTFTNSNAYVVGTKTNIAIFGSTGGSFTAEKWYIAESSSAVTASQRSAVMSNWHSSVSRAPRFFETDWGSTKQYLKSLNVTVSKSGTVSATDFTLLATYGTSYPTFENIASSGTTLEYWSTTIPDVSTNKGNYLWTKTTITYQTGDPLVQYGVQYIPTDGEGKGISSITQYFCANTSDSTAPTSGWVTVASQAGFNQTSRYLWTYTRTDYTNSTYTETAPYIIGVWGLNGSSTGSPGRGIANIEHEYTLSSSNSYSNRPTSGWSETPPTYEAGKYYWERDKITWTDGTTSYTDAILSAGINEAIRAANELNPDYAEFIIRQGNTTYIDGSKIYTGSVTAGAIAAYEALINSLMSHNVVVDGSIGVSGGDIIITSEPKTSPVGGMNGNYLNSYCDTYYDSSYDSLNSLLKPIAYMKALVQYTIDFISTATTGSKLIVKNAAGSKIAALYPNALITKDTSVSGDYTYSYYGESALIGKDLRVNGSLTAGNIQKGTATLNVGYYEYAETSISFKYAFSELPVVVISVQNENGTYHKITAATKSVTTTGFTCYVAVDDMAGWYNSYGSFPVKINWIAIS